MSNLVFIKSRKLKICTEKTKKLVKHEWHLYSKVTILIDLLPYNIDINNNRIMCESNEPGCVGTPFYLSLMVIGF